MHGTYGPGRSPIAPPVFHGHEVKVSRSDWLTELRDPSKADAFRPYVHGWWLVAADASIVRDDLPAGWGLMVPHGPHTLRVVVPAPLNPRPLPLPPPMVGAFLRAAQAARPVVMGAEDGDRG
ncbi:hypothetical protein GCM10022215_24320 [Nocardioides fonticola]|uniref:Uncharacterized protein n=1 Tax=Nocardioides fonticola TaxID=450363 RepID=A0ABP7XKE6_9ACTN